MTMDQVINVVVTITLVEMMVAVGLGVTFVELLRIARDWRLVLQAGLANYVCVPAVTVGLLMLVHPADPTVSAGFLILAVCPGAPFGPLCTRIARGNVAVAVGLMAILAGSSAVAAPLLLRLLLPWVSGDGRLQVNAGKIVITLLVTQLLPLCAGLGLRHWRAGLAEKLERPANLASALLGLFSIVLILVVQYRLLAVIGPRAWVGMTGLLLASCASGWLLGGPGGGNRRAMALTTSLRNVGVGLVIAVGSFAGTAAVTAALAYGIFEIVGSLLLALGWGRRARAPEPQVRGTTPQASKTTPAGRDTASWGESKR